MFNILFVDLVNALWLLLIILWIVTTIFWLLVMQDALSLVMPFNKMKPANVWLTFVPLFGLYWQFAVVQSVGDSLGQEYFRRGIIPRESRPGFGIGFTANILFCCAFIPKFGILIALVSFISRLMHLFKIKKYAAELKKIISVQAQYPQPPQEEIYLPPPVNPESEDAIKKNNPERFVPPATAEEERKRWGRK